jgi:hypothetical protein
MSMTAWAAIAGACAALVGCGSNGALRAARDQASVDLRCSKGDLTVQPTDGNNYQATGCGGTVAYTCTESPRPTGGSDWTCAK